MELYAKARITESDAEILMKASDIIIESNGAARDWTVQQIAMRKSFSNAVIKSHMFGYGGKK
jgi:hypothetical protein